MVAFFVPVLKRNHGTGNRGYYYACKLFDSEDPSRAALRRAGRDWDLWWVHCSSIQRPCLGVCRWYAED